MKKYLFNLALSLLFLTVSNGFIVDYSSTAYDPSGVWNVEIETPDGTEDGVLTISKNDKGEFEATLEAADGSESYDLERIDFDEEEREMSAEMEDEGVTLEVTINFDGDKLEGTIVVDGLDESLELSMTGERET